MEIIDINVCRTCLGKLEEVPRNLFQANFTDVLDVLRGFVANLVDVQTEDAFNVCSFCYEKLDYICKFKRQCQKSFDDYMEIRSKKLSLSEDPVISNLGQIIDDDYLSTKIDLDSQNLDETITIYKNSEEIKSTELEANFERTIIEPIVSGTKRGSRAKQFPTQDVLSAIDECTSYQTNVKNRKCIHCTHLAKMNRQLCIHMKYKHAEEVRTWCSRCNVQTNDLAAHLQSLRCCEYVCKFCNKKCRRLFMLMAHVKSHASAHFAAQAKRAKIAAAQDNFKHKAPVAPHRDDIPPEQSLQQLSNVVFQYDDTVADAAVKMDTTTECNSASVAPADGRVKASRITKQYDSALVLQALAECTNFLRHMKNRICGQCSVVTTLSTGLNNHMLRTHSNLYPLWCNRCNIQTDDLQAHKDLVRCNTYSCKFCDKEFNKLNKLSKHLQCHCREIFRHKTTVDEEPTIQMQSFTCTSASSEQQPSSDNSATVPETTDGNITYENSQQFFFADGNAGAVPPFDGSAAPAAKMDGGGGAHFDGSLTYEAAVTNAHAHVSYERLENTTDGQFAYEIKRDQCEDTDMCADTAQDPQDQSNVQDPIASGDDSISDSCIGPASDADDADASDGSHGSAPVDDWSALDQVDVGAVTRALTSVRKPVPVHGECIVCRAPMTDNRGLIVHMTIVHKEEREKWCRTCNDLFDDLVAHKKMHAPTCEFCNKSFVSVSHLRGHLKNHARDHNFDTSTWIACKACANIFPDGDSLGTHPCTPEPSTVEYNSELPYKCEHCDKSFADNNLMAAHNETHHLIDAKQNVCHICSKSFETNAQLEYHLMTHTGKTIKCGQCDKSFCFKAQLAAHMRQHTGEKPHLCTDCGRGFCNKTALASHIRHTHSEDRPYKCSYCDSSFKVKATLKTHEFIHTGLKPFKCTECPYSCRQSYRLTIHMKQHLDENKAAVHACIFCHERFATHLQLITHTYANHGEMPVDHAQSNTAATPNVVNITSHHIIIPDGASAQAIQIAGASRGDGQLGLDRIGADDSNAAMDEIDNVPIQIVYKPQEMG